MRGHPTVILWYYFIGVELSNGRIAENMIAFMLYINKIAIGNKE